MTEVALKGGVNLREMCAVAEVHLHNYSCVLLRGVSMLWFNFLLGFIFIYFVSGFGKV